MADSSITDSIEVWKPIPGFEGHYQASDMGRIKSLDHFDRFGRFRSGRVLKAYSGGKKKIPYCTLSLCVNGKIQVKNVHRLIAATFLGPCPPGNEVCHNNGDPRDNRLSNLRYDTRSGNALDRAKHGTVATVGERCSFAKLTEGQAKEIIARGKWSTYREIAGVYGVRREAIRMILTGVYWRHLPRPDNRP